MSSFAGGLVAAVEAEQVGLNAARARQLQQVHDLVAACAADPGSMSPTTEAEIEIGGVLGVGEFTVRTWFEQHRMLSTRLPGLWALCVAGRLDLWRAQVFLEAAETLADDDEVALFSADVDAFFAKHDDPDTAVVRISRGKLQRAAQYRAMKRRRKDTDQSYSDAFSKRRVWLRPDPLSPGIGSLGVRTAFHDLMAADYRLTLIAKKRLQDADPGDLDDLTLEQVRADTMVDLILGRLEVGALTADLEEDATSDGEDPAKTFTWREAGAFARPVVNVTVPITALMGLDDQPGILSGDTAIPAEVVGQIARQPGCTWYRLLTDPARDDGFVELSTTAYTPTASIWRSVVARDRTCVWPGCCRPSTDCDLDHRRRYPEGLTNTENLWPLCARHHRAKHADGYTVTIQPDGSYLFRTRHGTEFRTRPTD